MTDTTEKDYWNQIASTYLESGILSPFHNEESRAALYGLVGAHYLPPKVNEVTALEIGCGVGFFFNKLCAGFTSPDAERRVLAIDYAEEMLHQAKKRIEDLPVTLILASNIKLPLEDKYVDEAFAINSLLNTDYDGRKSAFSEIFRVLNTGGQFYGLFPSNENHLEQAYTRKEQLVRCGVSEFDALHRVYEVLTRRLYDPVGGFITPTQSQARIKLYSRFELEDLFGRTGFTDVTIVPFIYPSSVTKELHLTRPNNGVYDWFVTAKKE